MALTIKVLGGFEAVDDVGRAIKFHTRKAAALLVYLSMSPGKEFSRAHLTHLLWSDRAEPQAGNSLRQALSHLRKALKGDGRAPLVVSSDGVGLDAVSVSTDAVEFERVAKHPTPERNQIVDLYRGSFLADFTVRDQAFEDWRRQKASELEALAVDALDDLVVESCANQEHDQAGQFARALLSIDPGHESAHRALMQIHYAKGRRGAALQQYEICRDYLLRELGVDPESDTEALRRMILKGRSKSQSQSEAQPANTLGVLPFTTSEDDIDAKRLAHGLTASLATELGRFRSLSVVSSFSTMCFKDSGLDPREIADSLDVRYLVEGAVDRIRDRLQGFVRLTDPWSKRQIWSDSFSANAADFFDVMGSVIQSIVGPLVARLEIEEIAAARQKPAASLDAYDHWLRGLAHLRVVSAEGERTAREHFRTAIDLDPNFARAHAGLAMATFTAWSCGAFGSWHEDLERCLADAHRALSLDPSDHLPHGILACAYLFLREFEKSKAHFDRAIGLNPNDADLLAFGSMYYTYRGDADAGVEMGRNAIRLNPFYSDTHIDQISTALQWSGRYREAEELMSQMATETLFGDWSWLVVMQVELGNLDQAREMASTKFRDETANLWPGVSSSNDLRKVLETVNPWMRRNDHDRFFSSLERAGVFDD